MGFLPIVVNLTLKEWFISQRQINVVALMLFTQSFEWKWDSDNIVSLDGDIITLEILPIWDSEEYTLKDKTFVRIHPGVFDDSDVKGLIEETKRRHNVFQKI